jgi:hypothetical protein
MKNIASVLIGVAMGLIAFKFINDNLASHGVTHTKVEVGNCLFMQKGDGVSLFKVVAEGKYSFDVVDLKGVHQTTKSKELGEYLVDCFSRFDNIK